MTVFVEFVLFSSEMEEDVWWGDQPMYAMIISRKHY